MSEFPTDLFWIDGRFENGPAVLGHIPAGVGYQNHEIVLVDGGLDLTGPACCRNVTFRAGPHRAPPHACNALTQCCKPCYCHS